MGSVAFGRVKAVGQHPTPFGPDERGARCDRYVQTAFHRPCTRYSALSMVN